MAETSTIEWTDATWNPITGCSVVSPGCTNCYAMRLAGTRLKHHPSRAGLTRETKAGPVWTGDVRLNPAWLTQPLEWGRPRRIFVCAHGDLFHEAVSEEWVAAVFGAMALAPRHTFQVLTKRAARMREVVSRLTPAECVAAFYLTRPEAAGRWPLTATRAEEIAWRGWPLPNVWLGVSAEDQRRADERVPDLYATPSAVRFVSAEPLLGPVDLSYWIVRVDHCGACGAESVPQEDDRCPACGHENILVSTWGEEQAERLRSGERYDEDSLEGRADMDGTAPSIDWVIVGGESGPGARPMHPDWARGLRDQCAAAGVPFLFKQWGTWKPICAMTEAETDALYRPRCVARAGENQDALNAVYGRVCTVPDLPIGYGGATGLDAYVSIDGHFGMQMFGVGKAAAGRLLDGVQHDGMPEVHHG